MLRVLLKSFLCLTLCMSVHSTASDWSGQFQDTTFGGSLFVCVSDVTETDTTISTIGQGVFSQFGYMRGVIVGDNWQGEYFLAGIEARKGSFNFTLSDDGMGYSGSFVEQVGYSYGMSGSRLSVLGYVPSDTDCFKSDVVLLTRGVMSEPPYSYTSNAIATNIASNATQTRVAYSDTKKHVSVSWTASFGIGYNYGPSFLNGQVVCAQWYESNANEGIELFVAKDLTSFYSIWLMSSSVSVFNYTQVVVIDQSFGVEVNDMVDTVVTAEEGMEFSFLRLLTKADESVCADAIAGDSLNCNDDNDDSSSVLTIIVVLLVISGSVNIFVLMYFIVNACRNRHHGDSNQAAEGSKNQSPSPAITTVKSGNQFEKMEE